MAKVAFIGLGVMGYPMARHLAKKGGHDLTVYNRTREKAEKWVAENGGRHADTPRKAAEGADFVFSCVGNDDDLRSVALGDDGILAGMRRGAIYIDNTTASADRRARAWRRRRKSAASASSTRRFPAARPARRTASSR